MGEAKNRGTYEQRKAAAEKIASEEMKRELLPMVKNVFEGRRRILVKAKNSRMRQECFKLYSPPFNYHRGYIWDSKGEMVCDDGGAVDSIARIRGWGRLQYIQDGEFEPEELQDCVGELVAEALTKLWTEELSDNE